MRVLVVGGPPRSGTRFVTNALNAHPDVFVSGEVPERHVLPAALAACRSLREAHGAEGRSAEDWAVVGPSLLVQMAALFRKRGPSPLKPMRALQGFKSPRIEYHWREIAAIAGPFVCVFCLRPFAGHYLSCANRWSFTRIESLADRYLRSIREAEEMMQAEAVELAAFSLPELGREGVVHLAAVGRRLGLRDADAWAASIDLDRKANSAEKFVEAKRSVLSRDEAAYIEGRDELRAAHDGFWEAYGTRHP